MMARPSLTGGQDYIPRARNDFDLVGTSQIIVIHETPGVTRAMCWSGSSPARCISIQIAMTLLNMSDRSSVAVIL
jgi:hypothetical protein